jgi:hypothetical protein
MRDYKVSVVRLPVERHNRDHHAGQPAEDEDEQESEDEQHGHFQLDATRRGEGCDPGKHLDAARDRHRRACGDHRHHPGGRKKDDVLLRMAEEPEQVLPQQRVAALVPALYADWQQSILQRRLRWVDPLSAMPNLGVKDKDARDMAACLATLTSLE